MPRAHGSVPLSHPTNNSRTCASKPHGRKWPRALFAGLAGYALVSAVTFLIVTCAAASPRLPGVSRLAGLHDPLDAADLSARLTVVARVLYAEFTEGRMPAEVYQHLAAQRSAAHRLLIRAEHGRTAWGAPVNAVAEVERAVADFTGHGRQVGR